MTAVGLLVNPRAGRGRAVRIYRTLRRRHPGLRNHPCWFASHPGAFRTPFCQAVRANLRRIVVIGGDGTVRMAASVLHGTGTSLGLVPGGSSNDWARTCGIPKQPLEALDLALKGEATRLDLGVVHNEASGVFVNVSGAGFDARVVRTVSDRRLLQWIPGARLPWLVGALGSIPSLRIEDVRLTIDGDTRTVRQCGLVLVCNGGYFGGGLPVYPEADPADGQFTVIWTTQLRLRDLPWLLVRLLRGRHLDSPRVQTAQGRQIELRLEPEERSWPVESDGEPAGTTPLEWSVSQGGLAFVTGPDGP